MERASFAKMECPIARAVDQIGDAWTLLILREAYKGASLFTEFQERLPVAPTTLTRKLEALVATSLLERTTYQTKPRRDRYTLTEKSRDLLPVLLAIGTWGERWLAPDGNIFDIVDTTNGRPVELAIVDRKTHRPITPGEVALTPGPGASKRLRSALREPLVLAAPDERKLG